LSLPIIGWREVLKALKKQGFYATRQSGSHIIVENGRNSGGRTKVLTVLDKKTTTNSLFFKLFSLLNP
jgi:predicted RNA binding protein YcfA (HicA-like mRNA interferase family)